ncbi:novobiocin biosynthesis protein NovR [Actinokineospora alba]|uniref:Novobiocin biosynthesis protein NovR n=1 Tax=Actinokineospora alba TaxID=504798 RepID=A0A1H0L795_9PSEU|nr:class II aldolase/adducin family protein [Actinokineospora alba]TDP67222.1 novobiocin biosynthesis protein NovR [Actinokineospora alba]SDJ03789.1 novobiocin biosynthesis protein NovR [Actinokineospora alba]SDO63952.1 novobiocin biosynthesis protein NovR [Actinokineospora alba]
MTKTIQPADNQFLPEASFDDPQEARAHLKSRLAAAFWHFAGKGFDEGIAGIITVRDPEHTNTFWTNPITVPFAHMTPDQLIRVDGPSGVTVEGEGVVNLPAFSIHAEIHAARPDTQAAIHLHTNYGRAYSSLGKLLEPITQDHTAFFEDHAIFDDFTGIVFDRVEGKQIAAALGECKGVILRNHGLVAVAETLDAAVWWFTIFDTCCYISLIAQAAGTPIRLDDEVARLTAAQIGSHQVGYASAQRLLARAASHNPPPKA